MPSIARRCAAVFAVGAFVVAGCTDGKHSTVTSTASPAGGASASASASPAATTPPASSSASAAPAGASIAPALQRFYSQRVSWSDCEGGFRCAHVKVPLDYTNPGGKQIEIAAVRLPAGKPSRRIGSLFVNPGGPGGSGISYARSAESVIPKTVRDRFDIVGFDPRGVGESAPIHCFTGPQLDAWLDVDPSPDNAAELGKLVDSAKGFANACQAKSAGLLPFVSTRDAARDMDILRAVVGDEKLTYLGKSYGTYMGALYADLFPGNVRALILDGAVDPALDGQALGRSQARGFEGALVSFLAYCDKASSCAFAKVADPHKRVDDLLARIEEKPLATGDGDGRRLGPNEAFIGIAAGLYNKEFGWPALAIGLARADNGDGSILLRLFDSYAEREAGGKYSNEIEANMAINCIDRPSPRDVSAYQADAKVFASDSPTFGASLAYGALPCAFWTVPPVGPVAPLPARGAAPILVIGNTRDPATPLEMAKGLSQELESGRLLTYDGDGHTAYGDGVSCVDNAGNDYLIELKVPPEGKLCR
jgi:pimeloyl-ACP methyl ester carboxylesterase